MDASTTRRGLLLGAAASLLPGWAAAAQKALTIDLVHQSAGERLRILYYLDGRVDAGALARIDWFLRDRHVGQAIQIDRHLIYGLSIVQYFVTAYGGAERPISVLSGYRSAETNRRLVETGGAAVNSFHITGQAIDFRMEGVPTAGLARLARALGAGGIGIYPQANFVHMDTGPKRGWVR